MVSVRKGGILNSTGYSKNIPRDRKRTKRGIVQWEGAKRGVKGTKDEKE